MSGDRKCCPKTFTAPANRSGNKVIRTGSDLRKAGEEFDVLATFAGDPDPCLCRCCEYHQYVRGTFTYNGRVLPHYLPSGLLSSTEFKEDGLPVGPPGPHFGHRDEADAADDQYLPTRLDGCEYRGYDFPGIMGAAGARFEIDLEFRGEIVDVCNGDAVLQSATWSIKFSGRLSHRRR